MAVKEFTQEQKDVMVAFGDAIKAERPGFMQEGVRQLDDLIQHMVGQAFESINDLEGGEADELKAHLVDQMKEYTRRGLQRAVKGIAKYAEEME